MQTRNILEEKQCVILKGRQEGIIIHLDDKAAFDLIKEVLRNKVAGSRSFFEGAKTTVTFKGRNLSVHEEQALREIIQIEANFDMSDPETPHIKKLHPVSPPGLQPTTHETHFYQGNVRSGQVIRQNGSVVVVGDVNPGAVIKATGNIIILGSLRGMAWAGAPITDDGYGSQSCYISASDFNPTQVRIARVVTYIQKEAPEKHERGSWAYIHDDQVFIAPL